MKGLPKDTFLPYSGGRSHEECCSQDPIAISSLTHQIPLPWSILDVYSLSQLPQWSRCFPIKNHWSFRFENRIEWVPEFQNRSVWRRNETRLFGNRRGRKRWNVRVWVEVKGIEVCRNCNMCETSTFDEQNSTRRNTRKWSILCWMWLV